MRFSDRVFRSIRNGWVAAAIVVLPVVAYVILLRRLQGVLSIVAAFDAVTPQLLLCAAVVVAVGVRQPTGRWIAGHCRRDLAAAGALTICLIVCVTPVILSWLEGRWAYLRIAGAVPWSDASAYHTGGSGLLDTGRLDLFNMRRPMNAGFYATRLALTGGNFWYSMLIQASVVAVCAFVFLRAVARQYGLAAALAAAAVLDAFVGESLDVTMSEALGFSVGCLAAAAILHAVVHADRAVMCVGLFLLGLALNIRAGEMLVLVALLVWVVADEVRHRRFTWRWTSLSALAVSGSFMPTFLLNAQFGVPGGTSNSNFSYTLYGLAHRGAGWTSYLQEFDPAAYETEAELSKAVYRSALEEIGDNPANLIAGLKAGLEFYLDMGVFGFMAGVLSSVAFALLVLGGVRLFGSSDGGRVGAMCIASWVGMLASIPFIFQDGGFRVLAATVPLMALLPAAGAGFVARAGGRLEPEGMKSLIVIDELADGSQSGRAAERRLLMVLGACTAAVLIAAPTLVVALHRQPSVGSIECSDGEVAVVARIGEPAPHVSILPVGERPRDFGEVTLAEFRSDPSWALVDVGPAFADVPPGSFVQLANNLIPDETSSLIIVAPLDLLPSDLPLMAMCGRPSDRPEIAPFVVIHVDAMRRYHDDA